MAVIYSLDRYRATHGKLRDAIAARSAARPVTLGDRGRHAVDMFVLTVWTVVFGLGWVIRFPLACWVVIEWISSWFGHPGWHALAYLGLLVAIYMLPVLYTPKELRQ